MLAGGRWGSGAGGDQSGERVQDCSELRRRWGGCWSWCVVVSVEREWRWWSDVFSGVGEQRSCEDIVVCRGQWRGGRGGCCCSNRDRSWKRCGWGLGWCYGGGRRMFERSGWCVTRGRGAGSTMIDPICCVKKLNFAGLPPKESKESLLWLHNAEVKLSSQRVKSRSSCVKGPRSMARTIWRCTIHRHTHTVTLDQIQYVWLPSQWPLSGASHEKCRGSMWLTSAARKLYFKIHLQFMVMVCGRVLKMSNIRPGC